MIAHVNLANSGDAYVLVRWADEVRARYFSTDGAFQKWFRWHRARNPSASWQYVSNAEMDVLLAEVGLTMGAFNTDATGGRDV